MLVRLLYASRATDGIDEVMMRSILEHSELHNAEHGITGILCTAPEHGIFLQVIEGSRHAVNTLYANLVRDGRHRDVALLQYGEIQERRFASWRMGSVDLKRINRSTILRFSERPELDPFSMTGAGAMALLEELADTAAIVSRDLG
jgi:hypothetical protein